MIVYVIRIPVVPCLSSCRGWQGPASARTGTVDGGGGGKEGCAASEPGTHQSAPKKADLCKDQIIVRVHSHRALAGICCSCLRMPECPRSFPPEGQASTPGVPRPWSGADSACTAMLFPKTENASHGTGRLHASCIGACAKLVPLGVIRRRAKNSRKSLLDQQASRAKGIGFTVANEIQDRGCL